jgi:hypothetical protein
MMLIELVTRQNRILPQLQNRSMSLTKVNEDHLSKFFFLAWLMNASPQQYAAKERCSMPQFLRVLPTTLTTYIFENM